MDISRISRNENIVFKDTSLVKVDNLQYQIYDRIKEIYFRCFKMLLDRNKKKRKKIVYTRF